MRKLQKILIVEDDPSMRYLTEIILSETASFEKIECSCNGKDAISKIQINGFPDLIFLDISMPVMDGFELLDELEKYYKHEVCNAKIVILTSFDRFEEKERALKYKGIVKYLIKPLTREKALKILNEI